MIFKKEWKNILSDNKPKSYATKKYKIEYEQRETRMQLLKQRHKWGIYEIFTDTEMNAEEVNSLQPLEVAKNIHQFRILDFNY